MASKGYKHLMKELGYWDHYKLERDAMMRSEHMRELRAREEAAEKEIVSQREKQLARLEAIEKYYGRMIEYLETGNESIFNEIGIDEVVAAQEVFEAQDSMSLFQNDTKASGAKTLFAQEIDNAYKLEDDELIAAIREDEKIIKLFPSYGFLPHCLAKIVVLKKRGTFFEESVLLEAYLESCKSEYAKAKDKAVRCHKKLIKEEKELQKTQKKIRKYG